MSIDPIIGLELWQLLLLFSGFGLTKLHSSEMICLDETQTFPMLIVGSSRFLARNAMLLELISGKQLFDDMQILQHHCQLI